MLRIARPPSRRTLAVILDEQYMSKKIFFILTIIIASYKSDGQNTLQPDTRNNKTGIIEVTCDSIYKDKNYKLKLIQLGKDDDDNYNFILIALKNNNGKEIEFFRDTIESRTQEIKFVDFNNDNIKDILVQNISDVRSNLTYYLYLVDPIHDKLKRIKGFEEIKNPNYLPKYNIIDNIVMSGNDWTSFYKIQGDTIKDFGILIYDYHNESGTYKRDYNTAIKTILKIEKNNR